MCTADCAECAAVADHASQMIETTGCGVVSSGPAGDRSITYTIGLLETFGHPELVITSVDGAEALRTLTPFVNLLRHGFDGPRMFLHDEPAQDSDREFCRFIAVNHRHLTDGTFCAWWDVYQRRAITPPELQVIQIVVPDSSFCSVHQGGQWLLDGSMPDGPPTVRLGRAERRAAELRARRQRKRPRGGRRG